MIYEKMPFGYDIELLRKHLREFVLPLPRTDQSDAFGGWSITSSNGDFKDGWFRGHLILEKGNFNNIEELRKEFLKKGIPLPSQSTVPTEICHGYFSQVMEDIKNRGLSPCRARVICLKSQSQSTWHQDMPSDQYGVRLHIPILTNEGCFFECDEGGAHLPADGSAYLLSVNRRHRVINNGNEHRYHIVMDICDRNKISQYHRLTPEERD